MSKSLRKLNYNKKIRSLMPTIISVQRHEWCGSGIRGGGDVVRHNAGRVELNYSSPSSSHSEQYKKHFFHT